MDLALNNLQWLICHKTQQTKPNQTNHKYSLIGQAFHITGHDAISFCSCSYPFSPCWSELLDNIIFPPSWRSSVWSFSVSWIILNCMCPLVVCEPCESEKQNFCFQLPEILYFTPLCSQITLRLMCSLKDIPSMEICNTLM